MFCNRCGNELAAETPLCPHCGAPAGSAPSLPVAPVAGKSKIAAGLLGIFVGQFGVHRFYLGYTGIGLAQIAVTLLTCGAGGLWGFVEGILILTGAIDRDAEGRPLQE